MWFKNLGIQDACRIFPSWVPKIYCNHQKQNAVLGQGERAKFKSQLTTGE